MKEYVVSKTDNIDIERVDERWSSIERDRKSTRLNSSHM